MSANEMLLAVGMGGSLMLLIMVWFLGGPSRVDVRLGRLSRRDNEEPASSPMGQAAQASLAKLGTALLPTTAQEHTLLKSRLIHAGLYHPQAMVLFLGVKLLLIIGPPLIGLILGLAEIVPVRNGLIFGALVGIVGIMGPSFWLDARKKSRQMEFRRALPDALDVLVIGLEGGLSLPAALAHVSGEIRTAHPMLATELNIVQREIHFGISPGEAIVHFAERCDMEEVRGLASVIAQAERLGASLVKSMRVHGEMLREKRMAQAEERAGKAAVKILFPTILCIFPCLFIVILGPAVIQIFEAFSKVKMGR